MIETLFKWQELAGAIIGAIAALLVALVVARDARRREENAAAMVVAGNLTILMIAAKAIREFADKDGVKSKDYPMFVASRLTSLCPTLSPLFESSVARLMPLNTNLAAHLELVNVIYKTVEHYVARIRKDLDFHSERGKSG